MSPRSAEINPNPRSATSFLITPCGIAAILTSQGGTKARRNTSPGPLVKTAKPDAPDAATAAPEQHTSTHGSSILARAANCKEVGTRSSPALGPPAGGRGPARPGGHLSSRIPSLGRLARWSVPGPRHARRAGPARKPAKTACRGGVRAPQTLHPTQFPGSGDRLGPTFLLPTVVNPRAAAFLRGSGQDHQGHAKTAAARCLEALAAWSGPRRAGGRPCRKAARPGFAGYNTVEVGRAARARPPDPSSMSLDSAANEGVSLPISLADKGQPAVAGPGSRRNLPPQSAKGPASTA